MKIKKTLKLSSQTLRVLSSDSLRAVGGAISGEPRCRKSLPLQCGPVFPVATAPGRVKFEP